MGQKIVLFLILWCFPVALCAADPTAAAYAKYLGDARASGMGMAGTAWASDATTVYWNPASLSQLKCLDMVVMTSTAFDTTYASVFFGGPSWGVGYSFAGTGGIYGTVRNIDNVSDQTGDTYSFAGHVLLASVALPITPDFSMGITGKYLAQSIGTSNVSGFGVNIGARYQALSWCSVGMVAENLVVPVLQWNTPDQAKETLAFMLRGGIVMDAIKDMLIISTDYVTEQNRSGVINCGVEYRPIPLVSVSGGSHSGHLALGTGILLDQFRANMSWEMAPQSSLDDLYRFSIGLGF